MRCGCELGESENGICAVTEMSTSEPAKTVRTMNIRFISGCRQSFLAGNPPSFEHKTTALLPIQQQTRVHFARQSRVKSQDECVKPLTTLLIHEMTYASSF